MNKFLFLIMFVVSLLTGCASVPMPTEEGSYPPQMKSVNYYKTNLNEVIKKAEAGDASTQYELAFAYGNTWYGIGDAEKSNYWVERAATQNYLPAMCALAARKYGTIYGYKQDINFADSLVDKAYNVYISKPESEWTLYDKYMISGSLTLRGQYSKTKEAAKKYICLAKDMHVNLELRIYGISKQMREKGIKCD